MCKVSSRSVPTVIKIKYFVPDLWTKLENTFSYQEWQINPNDFPNRQTNKTTGTQRLTLQVSRHCGMFWKRTDSHKPPLFNFCDRIPITRGSITFTLKILQPFYHNVSFVFAKAKFIFIFGGSLRTRSYFYFLIKAAPRQTLLLEKNFSDSEWYFFRSFRQINLPCFAIVNSRNALPRVLYILISTDLSALPLFPAKFFYLNCFCTVTVQMKRSINRVGWIFFDRGTDFVD